MYTVGLTGQIACGKSSVARELQKLGAVVINADDIGREVVEQDTVVLRKLKSVFGKDIVSPAGKLDRRKLGAKAFASDENTLKLNRIVHPALLARLRKQIAKHRKDGKTRLLVVDAALILEWQLDRGLDVVMVVDSTRPNTVSRWEKQGVEIGEAIQRLVTITPIDEIMNTIDTSDPVISAEIHEGSLLFGDVDAHGGVRPRNIQHAQDGWRYIDLPAR